MYKVLNLSSALLLSIVTYVITAYIIFITAYKLCVKLKLGSGGTGIVYIGSIILILSAGALYLVSAHIAKYSDTTSTFYDNTAFEYSIKKSLGMSLVVSIAILMLIINSYFTENKIDAPIIQLVSFIMSMLIFIYTFIIYERI